MTSARVLLAVPALAVVALGLTACDKPSPGATAYSGTNSVYRQASCWAPDDTYLSADSCNADVIEPPESATIPTVAGQTIGISVDPSVAEIGWYPVLGNTRLTENPVTDTYFRFTPTEAQVGAPAKLFVLAGDTGGTRGVWTYQLVPAGAA